MKKLIDITGKTVSGEWGTDDENGNGNSLLRTAKLPIRKRLMKLNYRLTA